MARPDALEAPLEELAFLARSANRVKVLDALTDGPVDRRDLGATAGVSRATLGRILDDFASRGWVVETPDRAYEATQLGAYVSRELAAFLERFAPVPELNEVARWFPEEGFGFDLGRLAGATVVRATRRDALAPTTYIARRIREADRVRLVTYAVLPGVVEACWRGAVDRDLSVESVFDPDTVGALAADPRLVEQALEMVATGRTEAYISGDDVDSTVFVVDDVVLLCLSGGEGAPHAVIETADEAVLAWAEERIEAHRRTGERLDPSLFTA